MKTTVIGAYPKIGDDLASQELRRALHRHDREEIDDAELETVFDAQTRIAIGEIESAGIDVTNDGQVRWDDLLAPVARTWSGVERGPLERFYDNNTYFRQPVIKGPIATDGQTFVRDYTFATLAQDEFYRSIEDRVLAVADATAREIRGLNDAGARMVDIEDPAVVASARHIELAREAYGRLADAAHALALVTYFFPPDAVLESLASFPVAAIAIDVRSRDTTAFERLDALRTKYVLLGVVDARNTRLETAEEVARYAERALKLVPEDHLKLAPTTSLEYLPRDIARAKLSALVEGARLVTGT